MVSGISEIKFWIIIYVNMNDYSYANSIHYVEYHYK